MPTTSQGSSSTGPEPRAMWRVTPRPTGVLLASPTVHRRFAPRKRDGTRCVRQPLPREDPTVRRSRSFRLLALLLGLLLFVAAACGDDDDDDTGGTTGGADTTSDEEVPEGGTLVLGAEQE